jgi:hypothetical protein
MDDPWESLSQREESAKMLRGIRAQASETNDLRHRPKPGRRVFTSRLQAAHTLGASATPIAALSGSTPKSLGFAGG